MSTLNALQEIGARTVRDLLKQTLQQAGLAEAVGFELKLTNGSQVTVSSDSNPVLNEPADTVADVKVRQSARAGFKLS